MMPVITGLSKLSSCDLDKGISQIDEQIRQIRFVHDLEKLLVTSIGIVLYDAGLPFLVGNDDVSLYVGIDNSIEEIKNEYFNNILSEGILGASPLLFPFTSPNALTAQATIAFDIRGESITLPIKYSSKDVIEYAMDCIVGRYTKMAIAGGIRIDQTQTSCSEIVKDLVYTAEFLFLEDMKSAMERGIKIYHNLINDHV
jgi:3-oxoacyl-(acyl-carrier-protein) synthase